MDPSSSAEGLWLFLRKHRAHIGALVFSLVITIVIVAMRDQLAALKTYGYVGIFITALLGNATVILPVPSLAVVFAGGSVLNPLAVGLVAGIGEPIGELTGYLAGYGGSAAIDDPVRFEWIGRWMRRRGFLTLLTLSAIPNPLFDMAGITAGMLHFPVRRFLLACWIGKTIKAVIIAYLGAASLGRIGP